MQLISRTNPGERILQRFEKEYENFINTTIVSIDLKLISLQLSGHTQEFFNFSFIVRVS